LRVRALSCWLTMEIQHDLDAVLGTELTNSPTPVAGVPNLQAMNIDAEQAIGEYRERTVGPYRGVLPPQQLKLLEERLSGACTVEVAAFDEFALLLSNPDRTQEFDHVIFDTAPTGHHKLRGKSLGVLEWRPRKRRSSSGRKQQHSVNSMLLSG
jgi:anion-transporting  ArsA/GET3 family ATPase